MRILSVLAMAISLNICTPAVFAQFDRGLIHPRQQLTGHKFTSSMDQILDSTISEEWDNLADQFVFTEKYEYEYDGTGNCTQSTTSRWDSTSGQWIKYFKETNQWDGNGRDMGNEYYRWSGGRELWNPFLKIEKNYDANGYENLATLFYGDTITGLWIGSRKYESILDSKGQLTEIVTSLWDSNNNQWLPDYKEEITWNVAGKPVLHMYYQYDAVNMQWVQSIKEVWVYNNDGTPDLYQLYQWIETKGGWIKAQEVVYQYDDQGRETLVTDFLWDAYAEALDFGFQSDHVYDTNGLITNTESEWDLVNEKWIPLYKVEYTLAFGIETLIIDYNWDSISGQWNGDNKWETGISDSGIALWKIHSQWNDIDSLFVPTDSVEFSNDLNGHVYTQSVWDTLSGRWIFDLKEQEAYNADGNIVLDEVYDWDNNTSQWTDSVKTTWYYSEHTFTPVPGINDRQLRVYPNPASEYVVFDMEDMSSTAEIWLFDSQGRQVLERTFSGNEPIRLGNLAGGIYLYKVTVGGNVYNGKIILRQAF
jgi:hypothetical protein